MAFVSIARLQPGMVLERDLYYYEEIQQKVISLHAGQPLTAEQIDTLAEQGISGAHVEEDAAAMDPVPLEVQKSPLTREIKLDAVENVKAAFQMLAEPQADVKGTVAQTAKTSETLVQVMTNQHDLLVNLADLRIYDDCTYNHSLGVCVVALAIAMELGLAEEQLERLGTCALLHDIGKMKIPIGILNKPGPLTDGEYAVVKRHADLGADFLKENSGLSAEYYTAVRAHHEKYDGTGYPYHLAGGNIPLYSRIISIADVYDALTAKRPYRKPASPREVVEYIMGGCDTSFDACVVDAFLGRISPFPVGSCVELSDRKFAIVTRENRRNPLRPFIRLLENPRDEIDLMSRPDAQRLVVHEIAVTNVFQTTRPDPAWAAEHKLKLPPPALSADRQDEIERHYGALQPAAPPREEDEAPAAPPRVEEAPPDAGKRKRRFAFWKLGR